VGVVGAAVALGSVPALVGVAAGVVIVAPTVAVVVVDVLWPVPVGVDVA